jgi:death-on-curing protein
MSIDYLELDDLLVAASAFLGRRPQVRDYGLLESALARPQALVNNRALVDGNKRLGWVATRLFYGLNGYTVTGSEDEKFALVIAVATGELDTVGKIAHLLSELAVPAS